MEIHARSFFKARIDDIVRRRQNRTNFDSIRQATLPFEQRLARALNDYRTAHNTSLIKFYVQDFCGGDWVGYVKVRSNPPGAAIRLIGEFYFKYCEATEIPPYSPSCTRWAAIGQNHEVPQGLYRYMAIWPDGHTDCDRIDIPLSAADDALKPVVIQRSGLGCKQ